MTGAILTGEVSRPARVLGVHGAAGLTNWTCLARRAGLDGQWEAIEWASVPPGGISGEHRHTRTEEIYFVLSGAGELLLDGEAHRMRPGDLALTGVGSRHGLRNVGDKPLNWLVIELWSPQTAAAVAGRPDAGEWEAPMGEVGKSTVVNLRERGEIDPRDVFGSPLEAIRIERLGPGERRVFVSEGREHTIFVLAGDGSGDSGTTRVPLRPSSSVTLPLGATLQVEAGASGIEFFSATLTVTR